MAKSPDDRAPVPVGKGTPAETSSRAEIDTFLARVRTIERAAPAGPRGRLIFALDATMSRQPTWDTACKLQGEMFLEAQAIGGLDVQLLYFRGLGECRASRWGSEPAALAALMGQIDCRGAYCRFNAGAAHELRELLRAVAAYAAGGMKALSDLSARRNAGAMRLLEQMK